MGGVPGTIGAECIGVAAGTFVTASGSSGAGQLAQGRSLKRILTVNSKPPIKINEIER